LEPNRLIDLSVAPKHVGQVSFADGSACKPRQPGGVGVAVWSAFLMMFVAEPALAYIDPGTGGFILQAIIGGIAAGAVALRMFWHRIVFLMSKRKTTTSPEVTAEPPKEDT